MALRARRPPHAPARQRADQLLFFATVPDGASRRGDPAVQGGFRNDPSVPDGGQKVILADHSIAISDQEQKKVEYLRLDLDHRVAASQLPPGRIDRIFAEHEAHAPAPAPGRTNRFSR
jgi:hypothetical protein